MRFTTRPSAVLVAAAAGLAIGGAAIADAALQDARVGSKRTIAQQRHLYYCPHKGFIREGSRARRKDGITMTTYRDAQDHNVFRYRIRARGARFYEAQVGISTSFDPHGATGVKTSATAGYFRDPLAAGDDGHITQISVCAR